jgi:hypothetical protein
MIAGLFLSSLLHTLKKNRIVVGCRLQSDEVERERGGGGGGPPARRIQFEQRGIQIFMPKKERVSHTNALDGGIVSSPTVPLSFRFRACFCVDGLPFLPRAV